MTGSPDPRRLGALALLLTACATAAAGRQTPAPSFTTSPDGVRIAYVTDGAGAPPLVFVHGWSCDRRYWDWQLRGFAKYHRVVGVDLAGHGDSGANRARWTIDAFGGDVAAVVDALDLERPILIGHSMGGDVIAETARRLKRPVAGLIWVDTYKRLGTPRTPDEIAAIVRPFRDNFAETTRAFVRGMFLPGTDAGLVDLVAGDMASAPPEVAVGALEAALAYDREMPVALKALKLPVIAINPETPATDLASMTAHGVEVMLMSDVGHFPMMESPERFNRILRTAIEKLTR
jgi:pimeloyl-ACP methyl ester carboxylesterase